MSNREEIFKNQQILNSVQLLLYNMRVSRTQCEEKRPSIKQYLKTCKKCNVAYYNLYPYNINHSLCEYMNQDYEIRIPQPVYPAIVLKEDNQPCITVSRDRKRKLDTSTSCSKKWKCSCGQNYSVKSTRSISKHKKMCLFRRLN